MREIRVARKDERKKEAEQIKHVKCIAGGGGEGEKRKSSE